MAEKIGEAYAKITADVSGMKRATATTAAASKSMVASLKTIEAAAIMNVGQSFTRMSSQILSAANAMIRGPMDFADQMDKMSIKTGMSRKELQQWTLAAELGGAGASSMQTGLRTLARVLEEAKQGSGEYVDMLKHYKITATDVSGAFKQVADRLRETEDAGTRMAMAQELLGRGGMELIPLLTEQEEKLAALFARTKDKILTDEQIASFVEAKDAITEMDREMLVLKGSVAEALLPALLAVKEVAVVVFEPIAKLMKENKTLATIFGFAVLGLGAAFMVLGTALKMLAILKLALGAATIQQWLLNIATYAWPIMWIVAGIAAIIAVIVLLIVYWDDVAAVAGDVWKSIVKAAKWGVNFIIGLINKMIRAFNDLFNYTPVGAVLKLFGVDAKIPEIPKLAAGGIVTRPTVAMIGEAGPEAIIPLHGRRGGGGVGARSANYYITINCEWDVNTEFGFQRFVKRIAEELPLVLQRG